MLLPDEISRVQALGSGSADVAYLLNPESKDTVEQMGAAFQRRLSSNVYFLGFVTTLKDSPLKDPRVRRALNMAVDRSAIAATVMAGAIKPASQLTHPGAFGYAQDLKPIPYDPAAANALLERFVYRKGGDGYRRQPNGQPLVIRYGSMPTERDRQFDELMKRSLDSIGVRLEIQ
jgi:ABC-type transport system substrate-binding protein